MLADSAEICRKVRRQQGHFVLLTKKIEGLFADGKAASPLSDLTAKKHRQRPSAESAITVYGMHSARSQPFSRNSRTVIGVLLSAVTPRKRGHGPI
jgi:hypothetical protein